MTESELVREIQAHAHDPRRRTVMRAYFFSVNTPENAAAMLSLNPDAFGDPTLPPPATLGVVAAAEQAVGFRFPPLLVYLWTEVANGGFGPGYGLFGVEGGFRDDQDLTAPELYLANKKREGEGWTKIFGTP